jgi:hypothetical protein
MSGVAAYLQQRTAFVRVLDGVFSSGADERLVTPAQLLAAQQQGGAAGLLGLGGGTPAAAATPELPADLAAALSGGLHTLQDLVYLMLTDLLLVENGAATALLHQLGDGGGGSAAAAAAALQARPGGFGQLQLHTGQWERLWGYVCSVLERETPEAEDDEAAGAEDAVVGAGGGEEDDPDDDFDDWDATGALGVVAWGGLRVGLCGRQPPLNSKPTRHHPHPPTPVYSCRRAPRRACCATPRRAGCRCCGAVDAEAARSDGPRAAAGLQVSAACGWITLMSICVPLYICLQMRQGG